MTINPWRAGFALGAAIGFFHLLWSVLVASGVAQPVLAFILWAHFLELPLKIAPFDLTRAIALVAVTSILGFLGGSVFAGLWNWMLDVRTDSLRRKRPGR